MTPPGILEEKDGIVTKISVDNKEYSVGQHIDDYYGDIIELIYTVRWMCRFSFYPDGLYDLPELPPPSQQDRSVSQPGKDKNALLEDSQYNEAQEFLLDVIQRLGAPVVFPNHYVKAMIEYANRKPQPSQAVQELFEEKKQKIWDRILNSKPEKSQPSQPVQGKECSCFRKRIICDSEYPECQPSQPGEGHMTPKVAKQFFDAIDKMPLPEQGKEEDVKVKMISVILSNPENINVIAGCLETYAKAALKSIKEPSEILKKLDDRLEALEHYLSSEAFGELANGASKAQSVVWLLKQDLISLLKSRPSEGWSDEDMRQGWIQISKIISNGETTGFDEWLSGFKHIRNMNKSQPPPQRFA